MNITRYVVESLLIANVQTSMSPSIPSTQKLLVVAIKNQGVQYKVAKIQQPTMILLALETRQIDFARMG